MQGPTICLDTVGEDGVRSSDLTGHSRIKRCTVHHSSWTQPSWAMEGPAASLMDPHSKMHRRKAKVRQQAVKRSDHLKTKRAKVRQQAVKRSDHLKTKRAKVRQQAVKRGDHLKTKRQLPGNSSSDSESTQRSAAL